MIVTEDLSRLDTEIVDLTEVVSCFPTQPVKSLAREDPFF
jgi:hypothetical protein